MIFVHKTNQVIMGALLLLLTMSVSASPIVAAAASGVSLPSSAPAIYELQTGSASSASQEFIAIYNNSDQPVDVSAWGLTYQSSTGSTTTQLGNFIGASENMHVILNGFGYALAGTKEFQLAHPEVHLDIVFNAGISGTVGHIQLIDADKQTIDTLGYGAAAYPEAIAKAVAPTGKILQRRSLDYQHLQDTNNNSVDFVNADLLMPTSGIKEVYIEPVKIVTPLITITEALPNPTGTDTGHEYIEFYNPNEQVISLKDYSLQIGPMYIKTYPLPDVIIEPGAYLALNDEDTGVTLPNTSASLRILGSDGSVLMEMPAYSQPADDVVWASDGSNWYVSYIQTPGTANQIAESKPCADGYERNSETGSCHKISIVPIKTSLTCPASQIRSIETNRCRKIATTVEPAICGPGKVRNADTGRCKNSVAAIAAKTCPVGQERNEETNRCRKVVPKTNSIPAVRDVNAPVATNSVKWWAAGVAGTGSASYAAYEWRQEVRRKLALAKSIAKRFLRQ